MSILLVLAALGALLVDVRLLGEQVHHAAQRRALAERHLDRDDLAREARLDLR
jgi:hypothetical protein